MKKVTWIGIGIMGQAMAGHLLKAGYLLTITTRTKAKALTLIQTGAVWQDTIADAVKDADVVFTMVGNPQDVKDVYFGKDGVLANVKPGTIVIDMTTSSPQLAQQLTQVALQYQVRVLDAPVSGGDTGAQAATLLIMVGGDHQAYDSIYPILEVMGKHIFYMGPSGSGQQTKMANQIAVAGSLAATTEAIVYAEMVGLDPAKVVEAIAFGSGASAHLTNTAPKIIAEDYRPGFYIKHFVKDMSIAKAEMDHYGIDFPMMSHVLEMYQDLLNAGDDELGTQALIKHYNQQIKNK